MSSKSSSFGLTQFILIKESKFVVFNEDLRNVQRSFIKLNERSTMDLRPSYESILTVHVEAVDSDLFGNVAIGCVSFVTVQRRS